MFVDIIKFIEMSVWLQQLAALLTIIGIPYAFLKLVIYKARHKIVFRSKDTYHEVTLMDHPRKPQSYWLQLMVKNKGFEISRDAIAYLTEIWIKDSEKKKYNRLNEFRSPVKLKWAHEASISPIEILPHHERRLDVCYICQGESILRIMAEAFPSGTIKNELNPGDYVFVVNVVSQNSLKPAQFLFNIIWDGKWKTLNGRSYINSFKLLNKPVKSFTIY